MEVNEIEKKIDSKIEVYQRNLKTLKDGLAEKDAIILQLEEKLRSFETKIDEMSKLHEKQIKELNEKIEKCEILNPNKLLDEKIKDIEEIQTDRVINKL